MLLLCQEIRNSWRDFARHLQLCEGDIDNIESIYSNHYERVSQVNISAPSSYNANKNIFIFITDYVFQVQ